MNVCIVHYHLRTGGVTSVIRVAASALRDAGHQVCILCGEPPPDQSALPECIPIQTISGLGYADQMRESDQEACVKKVLAAAETILGGAPDVWHIHNHSLGKGPVLPRLVSVLAERECPLVLQLHDFAEDGRPANYQRICGWTDKKGNAVAHNLYPYNENIAYAVLNSRDKKFLAQAGVKNICYLPNAVDMSKQAIPANGTRSNRWLYPTRAIRRKNIGEFILLSAMAEGDERFAVSRAPLNPEHVQYYAPWVRFVQDSRLPVDFAFGDSWQSEFVEMLITSRGVVTTSVAEGFGLAFLEPWLAGTALYGRDLAEITEDFVQEGMNLETLYQRFSVPLEWVGEKDLKNRLAAQLTAYYHAYGKSLDETDTARVWQSVVNQGTVDFGRLDEVLQRRVIERVIHDKNCAEQLSPGRLWNKNEVSREVIEKNQALIEKTYGVEQYSRRLESVYESVAAARAGKPAWLSVEHVLQQFMKPERFSMLRN